MDAEEAAFRRALAGDFLHIPECHGRQFVITRPHLAPAKRMLMLRRMAEKQVQDGMTTRLILEQQRKKLVLDDEEHAADLRRLQQLEARTESAQVELDAARRSLRKLHGEKQATFASLRKLLQEGGDASRPGKRPRTGADQPQSPQAQAAAAAAGGHGQGPAQTRVATAESDAPFDGTATFQSGSPAAKRARPTATAAPSSLLNLLVPSASAAAAVSKREHEPRQ